MSATTLSGQRLKAAPHNHSIDHANKPLENARGLQGCCCKTLMGGKDLQKCANRCRPALQRALGVRKRVGWAGIAGNSGSVDV